MTESEWLACTDPTPMLKFLVGKASDRKLRLFAVACCRRFRHMMTDTRNRIGVEVTEQYADGLASDKELADATTAEVWAPVMWAAKADARFAAWFAARGEACDVSSASASDATCTEAKKGVWTSARFAACVAQAELLHDIVGNPFRSVTLDPSWLTPLVVNLAGAIYDNRAFDCLPLLAGALEEVGCRNTELLAHCRASGPHVRGCWVVDLILGKE